MEENFSIKLQKEYFNFAASHFLIFPDGSREPLHGHNYRVKVVGHTLKLKNDLVFDFLDIKPVVRELCDRLDHKLLLPSDNPHLKITEIGPHYELKTNDQDLFLIPKQDILILPISNTSAERLAMYLAKELSYEIKKQFDFCFKSIEVEVEETKGQSAIYTLREDINAF